MYVSMLYSIVIICVTICVVLCQNCTQSDSSLVLVTVLFRHGQRTPDKVSLYPNDPYLHYNFYPYGLQELTNEGKRTEYKLGQLLRTRYDQFLGKIYTPNLLEAWSSHLNRTKMSLQLVLAGLFPPVNDNNWLSDMPWQPVPYYYWPIQENKVFYGTNCPGFLKLLDKFNNTSPAVKEFRKQYEQVFDYVASHVGEVVTNLQTIQEIYYGLLEEDNFGLKLPYWTRKVYPQPLKSMAQQIDLFWIGTTEMRKFAIGYFFQKLLIDMKAKIDGTMLPKGKKLFLYSGHDINILYFLIVLQLDKPQEPTYGSHIIIELHLINNVNGVKIFYQDYKQPNPRLMKLQNCDEFCPFQNFSNMLQKYLPDDVKCGQIKK